LIFLDAETLGDLALEKKMKKEEMK
jgi:hypothetical protein